MKITLDINKKTAVPVSKKILEKIAEKTIKGTGMRFLEKKSINLSLVFLSARKIKEINRKYRKIYSTTDVLSFSNFGDEKTLEREKSESIDLGELLIDYEYIKKSAKVNRVGINIELAYVFSHGILHLLGIKHGKKMFALQDKIVQELSPSTKSEKKLYVVSKRS